MTRLSIILPAKNEAAGLDSILRRLVDTCPDAEILVVDDGSTDTTEAACRGHGVTTITHPYSKGNGAAVKSGARAARGDTLVFMDADGQHRPEDVPRLLDTLDAGYDMVVGARSNASHAGTRRLIGNALYNRIASLVTGHRVADLTSGFRAVRASLFKQYLYLLPNGFSYPTTITMAFFRSGLSVTYVPIEAPKRIGKSHLKLTRDGIRFLVIIFKIGTLYSPLKVFMPFSALFILLGLLLYGYTFASEGRFTNMSALLLITGVVTFLIGLVAEQITILTYAKSDE